MKKYLLMASAMACASFTAGSVWAGENLASCFEDTGLQVWPPGFATEYESGRRLWYRTSKCSGAIRVFATAKVPSGSTLLLNQSSIPSPVVLGGGYAEKQQYSAKTSGSGWGWADITFTYEWAGAPGVVFRDPPPPTTTEYLDSVTQRTTLASGASLRSLNRKYVLKMQADGNLVLYNDQTGSAIWWSGTQAYPGAYAVFQADGNFVVYDTKGQWRWASWTSHSDINARLTVGNDGNMSIVQPETYWWNSHTEVSSYAAPSNPVGQSLWPVGTHLTPNGGFIQSANGETKLEMQADGDLWLSRKGVVTWHSGTGGHPNAYAVMQEDGNMVIYAYAAYQGGLWTSGSQGHPGASMLVQDDGNMVIYTWKSMWATNTAGK